MPVALSSRMCYWISTINLFVLIWPFLYTKNGWLYLPFSPGHTLTVQGLSPGLPLLPTIINLHPHVLLLEPGRAVLSRLCKSRFGWRSVIWAIRLASVRCWLKFVSSSQSVSGCHQLIIVSVLPGTDRVWVLFSSRIWLRITNYYRSSQHEIKLLVIF